MSDNLFYDELKEEYRILGMDMEWTMRNGDDIKLNDMKDSHVNHTIKMLQRLPKNETRTAWIEIFENVLLKRRLLKIKELKS